MIKAPDLVFPSNPYKSHFNKRFNLSKSKILRGSCGRILLK